MNKLLNKFNLCKNLKSNFINNNYSFLTVNSYFLNKNKGIFNSNITNNIQNYNKTLQITKFSFTSNLNKSNIKNGNNSSNESYISPISKINSSNSNFI